jgi:hypothetical protein
MILSLDIDNLQMIDELLGCTCRYLSQLRDAKYVLISS